MLTNEPDIFFQRTTKALRKPRFRLHLDCGRQVELLAFHLEPAFAAGPETPRPVFRDVAKRLYPDLTPTWANLPSDVADDCFVCLAYFCSNAPTNDTTTANCSYLLVGGFFNDIQIEIPRLASGLLNSVTWNEVAENEFLW